MRSIFFSKQLFSNNKGFTLLELLIIVGVLIILASATFIALNPIEILKRTRDATRITDLTSLKNAISLYVTSVDNPDLDGATTSCATLCYVHPSAVGSACGGRHAGKTTTAIQSRSINGSGWIPIDFRDVAGGPPFSALPLDPVNNSTYFYSYACDNVNKTFEINAVLESNRYTVINNLDGEDGGNLDDVYEVGTHPDLTL